MALQYAKSVFPRDHIPSKYVLLLAAGDSKEDIYTEATVYLHSGTVKMPPDAKRRRLDEENEKAFPDFPDMMDYIEKKALVRRPVSEDDT
jgi:proteasome component ECM29